MMTSSRSMLYPIAVVLALTSAGCGSSPKTQLYSLQAAAAVHKTDANRAESRL